MPLSTHWNMHTPIWEPITDNTSAQKLEAKPCRSPDLTLHIWLGKQTFVSPNELNN